LQGAIPLNCYGTKSLNFIERLQKDVMTPKYISLRNHHINAVPDVVDCYPIYLFRSEGMKPFSRDSRGYSNWGAVYINKRMYDEAISECKKAIALDPNYAKAYFNLGSAYGNKGMIDEAIANYEQAITINPGYAKAHYNLALAYYFKGNYKLSIEHLDRAKELGAHVSSNIAEQLNPYR
jgi:tetratricopeptide (TPR) repeat protein